MVNCSKTYLSINIQDFDYNQRAEGDGDYVSVRIVEHQYRKHDDDRALEYGLPHPDAESLKVKASSLLEGFIERRELQHRVHISIGVKHQTEHG